MRKNILIINLLVCIAGFAPGAGAGEVAYVLQTNPFEQPVLPEPAASRPVGEPEPPLQDLELRATMTAGRDSAANVGGVIVGIGEEIEGYRLVSVEDEQAVFSKDGETITLTLDNEADDVQ